MAISHWFQPPDAENRMSGGVAEVTGAIPSPRADLILDGSQSSDVNDDSLTFRWTLNHAPDRSQTTLVNPTAVNPSIRLDKAGSYSVQLIVNDGQQNSEAAVVVLTTLNSAPVAEAGPDQSAKINSLITLDGGLSSDVDGDALHYTWTLLNKPDNSQPELDSGLASKVQFTLDQPGNYTAQLIVHDAQSDSVPDTVTISSENSAPLANPGRAQTVPLLALVQLNGGLSLDVDQDPLSYRWSILAKPTASQASLSNIAVVNPSFTADKAGDYLVQLIVNDGKVDSNPETLTISTQNTRPIANAGADQSAT